MKLARSDEANTAAALTRATPIISAEALDDVRRGARATFWRASAPGVLNSFSTGQPIARVTGRAIVDDSVATPRKQDERTTAGEAGSGPAFRLAGRTARS